MSSDTALAFINKVLLKLHKDSTKKHIKLREALKHATEIIKDPALKGDESVVVTLPQWGKLLNSVVITVKSAVEAKSHKFSSRTLDLFLRLIANGMVPGAILDEEAPGRLLLEKIVDTVRLCADTSDDATLMQVVKVVQAISASSVCGLHGNAMLSCFKIVYEIHLNARTQTQLHTTSRTTLSHVMNAPFKVLRATPSTTKFKSPPLDASSVGPPLDVEALEISASDIELLETTTGATPPTIDTNLNSNGNGGEDNKDKDSVDSEHTPSSTDITPREEREEPDFIAQSAKEGGTPKAPPIPELLSPRADVSSKPLTVSSEATLVGDELNALNDCLLLFNYLCKLSANAFDTELKINSESLDTRNKYLALELLYTVLESSGPSFRNYERFIHQGLREHLSVALMVNGNSPHPKIYKLVLSTFLHVLSYFRDFMKDEIEDFVIKILLRSLETTSMMQQRWMSLQVVLQICKNPQTLLDIFINYDCDLEMKDIFERIVNDLSKVSQGNFQTDHKTSPLQDSQVKLLALEALVVLLQSMVEWSHPLYDECQKMSIQSAHGEDPTDYITDQVQSPSSPTTMKELIQQADQFSKQKQFKMTVEKGKPKFAISAKKGMQYFLQIGVIKHHPEEVAMFFKNTSGLDKVKIGEYIGEKDDFNLEVMQCYVNLFNFAKFEIDIALRQFLSGFRLPGEAQKIDRIMEKFAERYYQTNQDSGTFASAESAYILAFAIVLLATDLHSSQIKKHMTKEEWVKMNRGNNAKQNFDEAYLLGIYDRIGAERLKLHAEGEGADESREFVPKSSQEIRAYHSARNINHVKSMFSTAWHAVLAAFSVLLDQTEDSKVVALILTGFKHAVRVSGIFSMDLERSAFITSLSKFTVLESLRDMKQKHIDSIITLVSIAQTDGNYIVDSWAQVQRCTSFLDRAHIYGVLALEDATNRTEREKDRASSRFLRNQKNEGVALDYVVQQIDGSAIDKIYNKSNLLSSSALLSLIKATCEVSAEEIYATPPSLFSLRKLTDIIYLNLYRVRPVWTKTWGIVAEHFTKVGTNDNLKTSMFAIETLRGIVIKILEQEDLSSYSFQKELIRPFETIFVSNLARDVQELIINSFSQIILARGNNISSGWKSIFSVFSVAASEEGQIMCLAFELIEEVLREYFHCIADVFFVDCVNSFTAFANNKTNRDVSLRAIESLNFCAVQLANGRVCQLLRETPTSVVIFTDTDQHMALWFPLLTGLARAIGHHYDDIRASALDNLFRVLSLFGSMFSPKLWELVFRGVLLPIFDNIGYSKGKHDFQFANSENPWLTATCMSAFKAMVDLFTNFIEVIDFLLEDMLDLFVSCILQDNEYLSRISCNSLVSVITANGPKFTHEMWTLICDHLSRAFDSNTPYEISDLAAKKDNAPSTRQEPRGMFLRNSDSTGFNSLPSRLGNLTDRPSTSAGIISQTQTIQTSIQANTNNYNTDASPPLGIRRRASVASAPIGIPPNNPPTGGFANQSLTDLPRVETIPASPPPSISSSAPVPAPFLAHSVPTVSISTSISSPISVSPAASPAPSPLPSPLPSPSQSHTAKTRADSHPPFSVTNFSPTPSASHSSLAISKTNTKHQNSTPPVSRTASVHDELATSSSNSSSASNPTPDTRRRAASVAGVPPPSVSFPVLHSTSVPEIQKLDLTPPAANPTVVPFTTATPSKTPSSSSFINFSSTSSTSSSSSSTSSSASVSNSTSNSFLKMGTGTGSPPVVTNRSGDLTARMRSRCIVQLLLIHAVDDIALSQYAFLLTNHLVSLIECLEVAYTFSHKTNKQTMYQEYLVKSGAVDLFRKQEINSISSYLTICFKLYGETQTDSIERKKTSEDRLIPRIKSIFSEFVDELDVVSKIPIIKQILRSLLHLEESQFEKNMKIFYTLLMNLMLTDNRDIRTLLRDIMHRLGKVKKLTENS